MSEQAMAAPAPKRSRFTLPSAYTILFALIVLAAIATWIIPAGTYDLNDAGEPIPGTYHEVEAKPSRIVVDSLTAPINGLYGIEDAKGNINYYNSGTLFGAIDIALFIIVIGGFLGITMKTGAIQAGIGTLVQRMEGRERLLIPALMRRRPRDANAPIVDRGVGIRLGALAFVMATLALVVVAWGEDRYDLVIATTMGLTTLSLMHIIGALEVREPSATIFSRSTLANRRFMQFIGVSLVLTFLVTALGPLQRIFDTVALTTSQWGICLLGPLVYLAIAELVKLVDRRGARDEPALAAAEA